MEDSGFSLEKIQFNPEKNSDTVRNASIINGVTLLRNELTNLFRDKTNPLTDNNASLEEINEKLSEFGVSPINQDSLYWGIDNPLDDCRDWVFGKIGLSHYTLSQCDQLLKKDSKELHCIIEPQKGTVVVYFLGIKSFNLKHWGIISEVDRRIQVTSKWNNFGVYEHNLELTPSRYGDYVMFFEKLDL